MSEWYLDDLRTALRKRGWSISELAGDGYRTSASWELKRSRDNRAPVIDFDELDDMRTLPIEKSYSCRWRGTPKELYFSRRDTSQRPSTWKQDLSNFVMSLESD